MPSKRLVGLQVVGQLLADTAGVVDGKVNRSAENVVLIIIDVLVTLQPAAFLRNKLVSAANTH